MEQLVIKRSEWIRGTGGNKSFLLRPSDGKKCCLGFLGLSKNIPAEILRNRQHPSQVDETFRSIFSSLGLCDSEGVDTSICINLIGTNDAFLPIEVLQTEEEREKRIKELFLQIGVETTFVD